MANTLGGAFRFPQPTPSINLGLGLGLASTKGPGMDRHEDEGWTSWMKGKGGGKKNNVALSALTLLAFLFFLNILQNCMNDHMNYDKGHHKGYQNYNYNNTPIIYINPQSREGPTIPGIPGIPGAPGTRAEKGDSADFSGEDDDVSLSYPYLYDNNNMQHRSEAVKIGNKKRTKSSYKKKNNDNNKVFEKVSTVEKMKN